MEQFVEILKALPINPTNEYQLALDITLVVAFCFIYFVRSRNKSAKVT